MAASAIANHPLLNMKALAENAEGRIAAPTEHHRPWGIRQDGSLSGCAFQGEYPAGATNYDWLDGLGLVAVVVFVTASDCIGIACLRLLTCLADGDGVVRYRVLA